MMWKRSLQEIDHKRILSLLLLLLISGLFLCLSYSDPAAFERFSVGSLFSLPDSFKSIGNHIDHQSPNVTTTQVINWNADHQQNFSKKTNLLNVSSTISNVTEVRAFSNLTVPVGEAPENGRTSWTKSSQPRVAICLVGGARRFELTGSSLLDRVVNVFNHSDLFLNSPLDENSYKLSLLKGARRIAAVRIARQNPVPETEMEKQVLTSHNSPNGLQGLLQYFNLVEGCLNMIKEYQTQKQIRYDWIIRTRLDGYWSSPLIPSIFIPRTYTVPFGSGYGGLNDRFGAGDINTSRTALARLSLIPQLFAAGERNLNSETAFKRQLETQGIRFRETHVPFCVLTKRWFLYPPLGWNIPVATMTGRGPLSGAYCRPCRPACKGKCASDLLMKMDHHFNWIDGDPELCKADQGWEKGWEMVFDREAGDRYAKARRRIGSLDLNQCIVDLEKMRSNSGIWDAPSPREICRTGSIKRQCPANTDESQIPYRLFYQTVLVLLLLLLLLNGTSC